MSSSHFLLSPWAILARFVWLFCALFFRRQSALVWFPFWFYQMKSRKVNVFCRFLLLFRLRYTSYVYMSESMIFIHIQTRNKRMISIRQHSCILCAIKHHWHFVIVTSVLFVRMKQKSKSATKKATENNNKKNSWHSPTDPISHFYHLVLQFLCRRLIKKREKLSITWNIDTQHHDDISYSQTWNIRTTNI